MKILLLLSAAILAGVKLKRIIPITKSVNPKIRFTLIPSLPINLGVDHTIIIMISTVIGNNASPLSNGP